MPEAVPQDEEVSVRLRKRKPLLSSWFCKLLFYYAYFVWYGHHTPLHVCGGSEDNFQELIPSSHHMGPQD